MVWWFRRLTQKRCGFISHQNPSFLRLADKLLEVINHRKGKVRKRLENIQIQPHQQDEQLVEGMKNHRKDLGLHNRVCKWVKNVVRKLEKDWYDWKPSVSFHLSKRITKSPPNTLVDVWYDFLGKDINRIGCFHHFMISAPIMIESTLIIRAQRPHQISSSNLSFFSTRKTISEEAAC